MTDNTSISRRRIVQGTAWTVPAVATAMAAPVQAASSNCVPVLDFSGGLTYDFGSVGSSSTTQILGVGGQTSVYNLPPGVNVTSVTYNFWVENRIGQPSRGPGAYWMGNGTSDKKGTCTSSGCSASWTPTAGSGFAPTVTNTANLVNKVYPRDGLTRQSWDLNMRWDSTRDANLATRYTPGSGTCRNFTTGPSDRFKVTYTGVMGEARAGSGVVNSFVTVTVTLDNGKVLTATVQSS